ncbi:MAG: M42 family peptidase, partial [Flavobacteriales bacterium]|nr:M42 family peptidase [Flavobacteriales bacterium]
MAKKKIITKKSEAFLEAYLNNPSPTGFESGGQKMWLDYIKPYIDTHFV